MVQQAKKPLLDFVFLIEESHLSSTDNAYWSSRWEEEINFSVRLCSIEFMLLLGVSRRTDDSDGGVEIETDNIESVEECARVWPIVVFSCVAWIIVSPEREEVHTLFDVATPWYVSFLVSSRVEELDASYFGLKNPSGETSSAFTNRG